MHIASVKHHAADAMKCLPTDSIDKTLLKDGLFVLMMERNDKIDSGPTIIFSLKVHTNTHPQFVTEVTEKKPHYER